MTKSSNQPLQIVNQTNLKVVIQVNSKETVPSGISKQVMATKNLLAQYQALGMKNGKDYEILMVFRSGGAQFLLNDAAYGSNVVKQPSAGNPNSAILLTLHNGGVKMYECHVAMKMKGYIPADIQPYAIMVETGIGALVDFEQSGYLPHPMMVSDTD